MTTLRRLSLLTGVVIMKVPLMCYFVAIGVPETGVEHIQANFAYELLPAPAYIDGAFERGTSAFLVNLGHCACGFFTDPIGDADVERLRKKYARKGWNQSRIERTLSQRRRLGGLDLGLVQHFISAVKHTGSVSLLVYWDDGAAVLPGGPAHRVRPQELMAEPSLIRAGSRVDIDPDLAID